MSRSLVLDVQRFAATPAAPNVTNVGTPGATMRSWKIVAVAEDGTKSAASMARSTTTGHATPDGTNFDRITWATIPGAASYEVWRTVGGGSQGKIGTTTSTTFDDTGLAGDSGTAPTTNGTGIGQEEDVANLRDLWAQVDGTFVGTIQLEGRVHVDAEFLPVGDAVTAPGFVQLEPKLAEVRARMTAYTSGAAVVHVAGNGRA